MPATTASTFTDGSDLAVPLGSAPVKALVKTPGGFDVELLCVPPRDDTESGGGPRIPLPALITEYSVPWGCLAGGAR
jgi:hypothetical protein